MRQIVIKTQMVIFPSWISFQNKQIMPEAFGFFMRSWSLNRPREKERQTDRENEKIYDGRTWFVEIGKLIKTQVKILKKNEPREKIMCGFVFHHALWKMRGCIYNQVATASRYICMFVWIVCAWRRGRNYANALKFLSIVWVCVPSAWQRMHSEILLL